MTLTLKNHYKAKISMQFPAMTLSIISTDSIPVKVQTKITEQDDNGNITLVKPPYTYKLSCSVE